ncbi:MAG: S49 family peptidase [Deltaproteobacteria bacterium]|nr:S49 family peptidase [Deltaproteobacteria bacterium]
MNGATFPRVGPLALDLRSMGSELVAAGVVANRVHDRAVVVTVRGPLMARRGPLFDSYEAILERVDAALASRPRAVVLDVDSPGGQAQGCCETARMLRAHCVAARVPLLAFAPQACSAAYALACAAQRLGVPPSGVVGSIGVYEQLASQARANERAGLDFRVIATGDRKADGNPNIAITDAAAAASQNAVDALGNVLFALVENMRGMPTGSARSLAGGIAVGVDAIAKRLADVEVANIGQLIASVPSSAPPAAAKAAPLERGLADVEAASRANLERLSAEHRSRANNESEIARLAAAHIQKVTAASSPPNNEKAPMNQGNAAARAAIEKTINDTKSTREERIQAACALNALDGLSTTRDAAIERLKQKDELAAKQGMATRTPGTWTDGNHQYFGDLPRR